APTNTIPMQSHAFSRIILSPHAPHPRVLLVPTKVTWYWAQSPCFSNVSGRAHLCPPVEVSQHPVETPVLHPEQGCKCFPTVPASACKGCSSPASHFSQFGLRSGIEVRAHPR